VGPGPPSRVPGPSAVLGPYAVIDRVITRRGSGRRGGVAVTVGPMVRGVTLTALAIVGGLVAGCGQKSDSNPQPAPSSGGANPSGSASASGSATPSPSGTPVALPDSCADILTLDEVDASVGKPLPGQTLYIKGQAEPKIKRTGRVTCRYGVHKGRTNKTVIPLEVGVSSYSDAGSASERITFTVNDQRNNGATASQVSFGDNVQGTLLISPNACLAVFAKGTATVAITLGKDTGIQGDAAKTPLTKVATAVAAHLP
jgi:hypothetical protein